MKEKALKIYKNDSKFVSAYNEDAYILHMIFNYKIVSEGPNEKCGFPKETIYKVIDKLEELNISYEIYYKKELDDSKYFDNSSYDEFYNKSLLQIEADKKIDLIQYKLKHLNQDDLNKTLDSILNIL